MDDLIGEFITETTDSLSALDSELVRLKQNPNDKVILGSIFGIMHTIKGTCGFLGLPRLENVARAGENVIGKMLDKTIEATPQTISFVLEALDTIKGMVEYLSNHDQEQEGDDNALLTRLNYLTGSGCDTAPAATATPSPSMPQKESESETVNQNISVPIGIMEKMTQMVSELAHTRNQLMQIAHSKEDMDFMAPLQRLSHITSSLNELMKTCKQSIGNDWARLGLTIIPVVLVEAQRQKFAIPQVNVEKLVHVSPGGELSLETIGDMPVLYLRQKLLPLAILSEILGFPTDRNALLTRGMHVVVCRTGEQYFGLLVDHAHDTEEVMIKPVSDSLKNISIYAGNTVLSDGSIAMILDPDSIARTVINSEIGQFGGEAAVIPHAQNDPAVGFLLFSTGKGAPKAVPLELVLRLEEVDVKDIEIAGDYPVVQYHADLMRLITMDNGFRIPNAGNINVIVLSYEKKIIGLAVKEVFDIVYAPPAVQLARKDAKDKGYLGSMVIGGRSTDVIDAGHFFADLPDQSAASNALQSISH